MINYNLRTIRKKSGYSQLEIATACHMDQSTYSRKESGAVKIDESEWRRFANFLKVKVETIKNQEEENSVAQRIKESKKEQIEIEVLEKMISVSKEIIEENKRLKEQLNKSANI